MHSARLIVEALKATLAAGGLQHVSLLRLTIQVMSP